MSDRIPYVKAPWRLSAYAGVVSVISLFRFHNRDVDKVQFAFFTNNPSDVISGCLGPSERKRSLPRSVPMLQ